MSSTDRIERSVVIHAPPARVWRALIDPEAFGKWFRADLTGQRFARGERARGHITYPGYEHLYFDVVVDRIEPETLKSRRSSRSLCNPWPRARCSRWWKAASTSCRRSAAAKLSA